VKASVYAGAFCIFGWQWMTPQSKPFFSGEKHQKTYDFKAA
jgi:hypothetical protein